MTDTTPIPEGALTVDDNPTGPHFSYPVRLDGLVLGVVSSSQRARLLAGPPRPDGVPDRLSISHELRSVLTEQADGWLACGTEKGDRIAADINALLAAVPPYQPTPDPADSPTEATHVEHYRTCNCLADSSECCRPTCTCHAPPAAAGERTGPLGLSEADTRKIAKQNEAWVARAVGSGTLACKAWDAAQGACRAAVAEWDAEPQPAETIDHIVAWLRGNAALREVADRIEAATRPDPDTITVNLPASNLADLVRFVERDGRSLNASVLWTLRHFQTALADRLAAAGLPQEDES